MDYDLLFLFFILHPYPMTLPLLLLALLIALPLGALFHVLRGGNGWRLLLYLMLSVLGFAAGQALSMWRGWYLLRFGALEVGAGMIGSFIFLAAGDWLSRIETNGKSGV
ncbi:MAG: hypothetical protein LDL50_06330 [Chloroflexi bacterium]|nr:hypothetical protein [Chloroflexota bacterium]